MPGQDYFQFPQSSQYDNVPKLSKPGQDETSMYSHFRPFYSNFNKTMRYQTISNNAKMVSEATTSDRANFKFHFRGAGGYFHPWQDGNTCEEGESSLTPLLLHRDHIGQTACNCLGRGVQKARWQFPHTLFPNVQHSPAVNTQNLQQDNAAFYHNLSKLS